MINSTDWLLKKVEKLLFYFSGIVTILITIMIVIDVFLRFVFNHPLPASWEISELCMPFIVFFAFAYTLTIDAHIRVTFIVDRISPRKKLWILTLGNALSFTACSLITYYSFLHFWQSFIIREEMLAAIKIPWWLGKAAMPAGMLMLTLRYLMQIILSFKNTQDTATC